MNAGAREILALSSLIPLFVFSMAGAGIRQFARSKLEEAVADEEVRERLRRRLTELAPLGAAARTMRIVFLVLFVALWTSAPVRSGDGVAGFLGAVLFALPVALIVGEILPIGIASCRPESTVRWTLAILYPVSRLLLPLHRLSGGIASWLGPSPSSRRVAIAEEIVSAADEAEREGVLPRRAREMIEKIVEFRDVQVGQVMTPRTDIFCIDVETPMPEVSKLASRTSHSRIPVYSGNRDTIVGIVYLKDLVRLMDDPTGAPSSLRQILRRPLFVPDTKYVSELLHEFQLSRVHMAIVVDEYGGTSGVVTIEDILEEIVGEIEDEYDPGPAAPTKRINESTLEVDAKVHIDEVNQALGLGLPEDDGFETLGGFVFSRLGKVPAIGEQFQHENVEFTVLDADERKINRVKITVKE